MCLDGLFMQVGFEPQQMAYGDVLLGYSTLQCVCISLMAYTLTHIKCASILPDHI